MSCSIISHFHPYPPFTTNLLEIKADDFSVKGTKLKEKSKDKKSSKDKKKNHDGTEKRPPKPKVDELIVSTFYNVLKYYEVIILVLF